MGAPAALGGAVEILQSILSDIVSAFKTVFSQVYRFLNPRWVLLFAIGAPILFKYLDEAISIALSSIVSAEDFLFQVSYSVYNYVFSWVCNAINCNAWGVLNGIATGIAQAVAAIVAGPIFLVALLFKYVIAPFAEFILSVAKAIVHYIYQIVCRVLVPVDRLIVAGLVAYHGLKRFGASWEDFFSSFLDLDFGTALKKIFVKFGAPIGGAIASVVMYNLILSWFGACTTPVQPPIVSPPAISTYKITVVESISVAPGALAVSYGVVASTSALTSLSNPTKNYLVTATEAISVSKPIISYGIIVNTGALTSLSNPTRNYLVTARETISVSRPAISYGVIVSTSSLTSLSSPTRNYLVTASEAISISAPPISYGIIASTSALTSLSNPTQNYLVVAREAISLSSTTTLAIYLPPLPVPTGVDPRNVASSIVITTYSEGRTIVEPNFMQFMAMISETASPYLYATGVEVYTSSTFSIKTYQSPNSLASIRAVASESISVVASTPNIIVMNYASSSESISLLITPTTYSLGTVAATESISVSHG